MAELSSIIDKRIPEDLRDAARSVAALAAGRGLRLYLVGGVVRDLLLGRPTLDLDLVVEGDALGLAAALAKAGGWQVVTHRRFGTAKLRREAYVIDLATARQETYLRPGALPTVRPGTIIDDLRRRDFTINAMAIEVGADRFGQTIDPHGGQSDLRQKLVRVLHPLSFVDDPTRTFRAIRYGQRLDFRLEAETERLLRRDIARLNEVSGDRLRHELELILKEQRPEKALRRAGELGALKALHPSLSGDAWLDVRFDEARKSGWASPAVYLALLAYHLEEVETLISRLNLTRRTSTVLRDTAALKKRLSQLAAEQMPPSAIYTLLASYSQAAIRTCLLASDAGVVRERLALYLDMLCYVKPHLGGDALVTLGVPQGEQVGKLLERLRRARLDGEVETAEEEVEMVRRLLEVGQL